MNKYFFDMLFSLKAFPIIDAFKFAEIESKQFLEGHTNVSKNKSKLSFK